jgi:NitT/TauT family transport system substrate-binding protein
MIKRSHDLARNTRRSKKRRLIYLTALVLSISTAVQAETIKIGINKVSPAGPMFVAVDRGYFAKEGLEAKLVLFDAAPPVATAVVSGAIDFGDVGLSASLYALAGQGALRIIAASNHEAPSFRAIGLVASNAAFAAGLKTLKDIPGHSVAISQIGSPPHYALALVADKYHFDLKTVHLLLLQNIPNEISAVVGGRADCATGPATALVPLIEQGKVKLLGWVGDETPWQLGGVFTAAKTANNRSLVERFLRGFRKGVRDYHDAFITADGKRKDGPTSSAVLAILAKNFDQPREKIASEISYFDPEAGLDVKDVLRQVAWYKAQGMLKPTVDGEAIIDRRYVVPLASDALSEHSP